MKQQIRTYLLLLSFANLLILPQVDSLIGSDLFHQSRLDPTPLNSAHLALLGLVFAISGVSFSILYVIRYLRLVKTERVFWLAQACFLIIPLNYLRILSGISVWIPQISTISKYIISSVSNYPIVSITTFYFAAYYILNDERERVSKFIVALATMLIPIVFISFFSVGYLLVQRGYSSLGSSNLKPRELTTNKLKVVWIIFDEFDQRIAFDHPQTRGILPELERFRSSSLYFDSAYAPGTCTMHSIPSLLSGLRLQSSREVWSKMGSYKVENCSVLPNVLDADLVSAQLGERRFWTQFPSVFREVKELGYKTGVLGWYHTYCNLFRADLDYCRRTAGSSLGYKEGFLANSKEIFRRMMVFQKNSPQVSAAFNAEQSIYTALNLVGSNEIDFVFLHLPFPHSPYIFDDLTKTLSPNLIQEPRNYIANLKLVDNVLGQIRQTMETQNIWNDALIVISSDHEWRKSTKFDGKYDSRVPYLIKMPDSKGIKASFPVATLHTKDLILSILKKEIKTSDQAINWLKERNKDFPVGSSRLSFEKEEEYYRQKPAESKGNDSKVLQTSLQSQDKNL